MENRNASGKDKITNKFQKYGGDSAETQIKIVFNKIMTIRKVARENKSIAIPIFKKEQKSDPNNDRGITLLITTQKLPTKIILYRSQPFLKMKNNKGSIQIVPQQMLSTSGSRKSD